MIVDQKRFDEATRRFDAANAEDPNMEIADGKEHPKELLYAQRMSEMLDRFMPDAPEAVKLAARCQHIRRWEIRRDAFPMDGIGYKQWRAKLRKLHSDYAAGILTEVGYDTETIQRVRDMLESKALKLNPEVQIIEDVVDLVFIEYYLDDFVKKYSHYDEAKLIDIIQKTWKKMSDKGHEAALKIIKIPPHLAPVILKAVGG
jgi:hypothetical protein